ncbi:MAG: ABC transporter permease [Dongiaceae bacterium]
MIRRCIGVIPTMFVLMTITFFMMRLSPGGPFSTNRKASAEIIANLNRHFHLDEPLWQQYLRYLWGVLQFDFGPSYKMRDYSVADLLIQGFPTSLKLGLAAILISTLVGVTLGTLAALRRNSWIDYGASTVGLVGIAVPNFVLGPLWQLLFGVMWGLLPVAGWGQSWTQMILPVVSLALPNIAYIVRLTRGSMIESIRSNHVRTARAKGLGERLAIWRHALIGGLLPVVAYLGPATAGIITGSIVVEKIFSVPGIGRYFVEAALNRDYTVVMGVTLLYGFLIILCNLFSDIVYGVLDPKVRYE